MKSSPSSYEICAKRPCYLWWSLQPFWAIGLLLNSASVVSVLIVWLPINRIVAKMVSHKMTISWKTVWWGCICHPLTPQRQFNFPTQLCLVYFQLWIFSCFPFISYCSVKGNFMSIKHKGFKTELTRSLCNQFQHWDHKVIKSKVISQLYSQVFVADHLSALHSCWLFAFEKEYSWRGSGVFWRNR